MTQFLNPNFMEQMEDGKIKVLYLLWESVAREYPEAVDRLDNLQGRITMVIMPDKPKEKVDTTNVHQLFNRTVH